MRPRVPGGGYLRPRRDARKVDELHRSQRRVFPKGLNPFGAALVAGLVLVTTLALRADTDADSELQYQLASVLFDDTRYREAVDAFDRAMKSADPVLVLRASKGKIRAALRIAEFGVAREAAERLHARADVDAEGIALYGDALWAAG